MSTAPQTSSPGLSGTLADLLRQRAGDDPTAVAMLVDGASRLVDGAGRLVHGGDELTYDGWDRRSNAVARGLVDRGVEHSDRVLLLFDNARWTDYAVSYLAVHKAGATAVPVGTRFAGPELAGVVRHSGASAIVCPPDLAPGDLGLGVDMPWVSSPAALAEGHEDAFVQVPVGPDDLADILYSSGTTGAPKGVAVSHASIAFHDPPPDEEPDGGRATLVHAFPVGTNAAQEVLRVPLRRPDRTVVVMAVFDPERFCALVAEHGVRRIQLVPAMAQLIVASGAAGRHDLSSVERVVLSSAPLPPGLVPLVAQAFPNAAVWNTYALTEGGTARTLLVDAMARPGSVGLGVGGTEVRVVDEQGADRPAGETGEVWLRRPGAPRRHYYRDPDATAATFVGDWLRTGDLGYLDADGYLYLVDRKKDVIVTGGLNVTSLEVEDVLRQHPAVDDVAVFGVAHAVLGQDVGAAVVLRSEVSPRALMAFARQHLAEYKTPHHIFVVDALPLTASGKVLKRELRDRFGEGSPAGTGGEGDHDGDGPVGARTPTEGAIVAIFEEVLDRRPIGVDDDFFDYGGHSLAAAQIVARVNQTFAIELPVTAVFDAATVAELAAMVEAALAPAGEQAG
ncbi:MAG TPA: non-ribosomal peptide synthetase [Acidimicrobiales bacterium]|nr:non-ribosomal peptide synthetase [Acidimicrobiales bacterium]